LPALQGGGYHGQEPLASGPGDDLPFRLPRLAGAESVRYGTVIAGPIAAFIDLETFPPQTAEEGPEEAILVEDIVILVLDVDADVDGIQETGKAAVFCLEALGLTTPAVSGILEGLPLHPRILRTGPSGEFGFTVHSELLPFQ